MDLLYHFISFQKTKQQFFENIIQVKNVLKNGILIVYH